MVPPHPQLTPLFCRQVPKLFPKYIRAPNGPEANPVKQLLPGGFHRIPPPQIKKWVLGGHTGGHAVP